MTAGFTLAEAAVHKPEHKSAGQVSSIVDTAPLDKPETGEWLCMHMYMHMHLCV